jgi:ADP-heptose:LPS heptosyltransferase
MLRTPALAELIAAVSLSDFVLSPDGGCMHIAAALGVPQVALFGKADPRQWGPINQKCAVLSGHGRADRISVEEAVSAAIAVMSRWGRRGIPGRWRTEQPQEVRAERETRWAHPGS